MPRSKGGVARHLPRLRLSASDRALETLWGVLIVLSVTGSAEVLTGASARQVFNLGLVAGFAWAVVEGAMDILRRKMERVRNARIIEKAAESPKAAGDDLAEMLRDSAVANLRVEDQEVIRRSILEAAARAPPPDAHLRRKDLAASVDTSLVLWSSTLPVLLPFLLVEDGRTALTISQVLAVATLFAGGAAWGHYSKQSPVRMGFVMAAVGAALAALLQFFQA